MPLSRPLTVLGTAVGLLLTAAVPAGAGPAEVGTAGAGPETRGFRVLPYLQAPSATAMTVTWFSPSEQPGTLRLDHPDGRHSLRPSEPEVLDLLAYTDAELAQQVAGLEQGSWLVPGDNVKHQVRLTGLRPGTRYRYTVTQDDRSHTAHLTTSPTRRDFDHVRLVALSDAETEPLGRTLHREWAPGAGSDARPAATPGSEWDQTFGTATLSGDRVLRYPLTEDEGYRRNLQIVAEAEPDLVLTPGDQVQGGGYQPGWDEFFRHNAGVTGDLLTRTPWLPAFGNWETFAAGVNGGYGTPADRSPVVRSRAKHHAYVDAPPNGTPEHTDSYYRIDHGPLTILTLDSTNGVPDAVPADTPPAERLTGRQYEGPGTDTQSSFTAAEYEAAGGTDLVDLNPGSAQYRWAERQLVNARRQGQVVLVQFHHNAFSSGEHGLPMNHADTSGQGGTPMRQYHPLFERFGVAAVLSGHSELFERSFVDTDGDGVGVHYYDVGVAGDGLRGERRQGPGFDAPLLRYNPHREWTADADAPEVWRDVDGVRQLVDGGKHYGHLQLDLSATGPGRAQYELELTPVMSFPVLGADRQLERTERRVYDDRVVLRLDRRGQVLD